MRRLRALVIGIAAAALTAAGQSQAPFTITTTSLGVAMVGQPFTPLTLETANGVGPVVWRFIGGAPFGFEVGQGPFGSPNTTGQFCYGFTNDGLVICTPFAPVQTVPGVYNVVVEAESLSTEQVATRQYTFAVVGPLQITTTSLPPATANQPYSSPSSPNGIQIETSGGTGQFLWSVIAGSLPPGIDLNPTTGVLSGFAPGADDSYIFAVEVLDQVTQAKVTGEFLLNVVGGLAITTVALPEATVNQAYSFQLEAKGGTSLFWSASTELPAGFSLSPDGVLSGFAFNTGSFPVGVQVTSQQQELTTRPRIFTLVVTLGPLSIAQAELPGATQNIPYSVTLTPRGGIPPYTWSSSAANLPGLSIGALTGVISGTPLNAGVFAIPVTLRDSRGTTFTRIYTLNVGAGVSISKVSLANGSLTVPYSDTVTATGGVLTYLWEVTSGSLPPGLTLNSTNGQISGIPTAQGTFPVTIRVTDFVGGTASKVFTITIAGEPLTITTTSLPGGSLNQVYSQTLAASGGVAPITWTLASGSLPAGLALNQAGVISGTPTALGSASFTVQARDAAQQTASRILTLTVTTPLTISANNLTTSVGVAISEIVTAGGGAPPYAFTVSVGALPAGLALNASTGAITGTPTSTGTFPVTLRVADAGGRTADAPITIVINALALVIGGPANTGSGQQPAATVSVATPLAGDVNGTLALTFASSAGGTDDMVRFSNGSRSLTFNIARGATTATFASAPNATVITGTVAGTITLTATVPGSPNSVKTIIIDPAVPVITSVTLQQVTGGLSVVVSGYSNTREVSGGSFTFTVSGSTQPAVVTVPLTAAFTAWFGGTGSNATGGQFRLTVPFTVSQGTATSITRVTVTLTNSRGTSAAASSP